MITAKQKSLEKKRLSDVVRVWAGLNKKVFWKYEVSSYYKSYVIKLANLPAPSVKDVVVSSNNRLLNDEQKTQLCDAIKKAHAKEDVLCYSSIDVQIDFEDGAVVAQAV